MRSTKLTKEFLLKSQELITELANMWGNKEVDRAINAHTHVNVSNKIYTVYLNINKMVDMYDSDEEITFAKENT